MYGTSFLSLWTPHGTTIMMSCRPDRMVKPLTVSPVRGSGDRVLSAVVRCVTSTPQTEMSEQTKEDILCGCQNRVWSGEMSEPADSPPVEFACFSPTGASPDGGPTHRFQVFIEGRTEKRRALAEPHRPGCWDFRIRRMWLPVTVFT